MKVEEPVPLGVGVQGTASRLEELVGHAYVARVQLQAEALEAGQAPHTLAQAAHRSAEHVGTLHA